MKSDVEDFIEKNLSIIYEYINSEILKGIGEINLNYLNKQIDDILKNEYESKIDEVNINILPYQILTLLEGKGKMDYTSMRADTINLNELNKEASVYYNYAKFYIKDELFFIDLMQMKIGGMPIDEDIVKFSKKIPIIRLNY